MTAPPNNHKNKITELKALWDQLFPFALGKMLKNEHHDVVWNDATSILDQPTDEAFAKLTETANSIVQQSVKRYVMYCICVNVRTA